MIHRPDTFNSDITFFRMYKNLGIKFLFWICLIGIPWHVQADPWDPPSEQDIQLSGPEGITTGIQLWLDANESGSIFQDDGGTTPVSSDGDPVGYWGDMSGNGNHVTQSSSGNQPVYRPSVSNFNGKGAIDFGTDDLLEYVMGSSYQGPYTVFIALQSDDASPATNDAFFASDNSSSTTSMQIDYDGGSNKFRAKFKNPGTAVGYFGTFGSGDLKLFSVWHDSTTAYTYSDGVKADSATTSEGVFFDRYRLGVNRAGSRYHDAHIAEVIVYHRALTACEIMQINFYLGQKYGRDFFDIQSNYDYSASFGQDINGIGRLSSSCISTPIDTTISDLVTLLSPSSNDVQGEFITTGHDGGGSAEYNFSHSTYTKRLTQIWKIDEDGDLGTVTVKFNIAGLGLDTNDLNNFALLTDTDSDFSNASAITSGLSYSNDTITITGVNFSDGATYTLATSRVSIDLTLSSESQACQDGVVPFYLYISNTSGATATGISVSDVLPSGFSYYQDTVEMAGGATYDSTALPTHGATGTVTWGTFDLPDSGTVVISYSLLVSSSQSSGSYSNSITGSNAVFSPSSVSQAVTVGGAQCSSPTTFSCEPAFYQTYRIKTQPVKFAKLDPNDGSYDEIANLDVMVNGMGFDVNTGMAYGANGKYFVSLTADGIVTDLGITFAKKCYVGDMDDNGYWYGRLGGTGGDMVKIQVSGPTLVATYSGQSMPGWDMAYNLDGNFYAVHSRTLYKFNTTTNTSSTLGSITGATIPNSGYGAQWTGADSMLYISNNSTGEVFRIDINTREARLVMTTTSGLNKNDGFSCPTQVAAVYELDYSDNNATGQARHQVYSKDADANGIPDYDAVWLGSQVGWEVSDPSNSDATGDTYDDGVTLPAYFTPGSSSDIDITLNTNISSKQVYYGLWIDWNNDNTFEDFYSGSSSISSSSTLSQSVNCPISYIGSKINMRCRVAERALISSESTGDIVEGTGEVEDYRTSGQPYLNMTLEGIDTTCSDGIIPYHLTIINNSGITATGISISDVLPSGFSFIEDTIYYLGASTNDSTLLPSGGATGTISWTGFNIPDSDSVMISYSILAGSSMSDGDYANAVTGSGNGIIFANNNLSQSVNISASICNNRNTFDCEPAFYQVYKKKGESNKFALLNPDDGSYTELAVLDANANGLGYDRTTSMVYGASGTKFIKLDQDGIITDMGITFSKKCFVGDMDTTGFWYGRVGSDILKIDVSGPSLVATYSGEGMPGWDMAYNLDGNFYSVHGTTLYKFNTTTNTKSTLGTVSGSLPGGGYGAQWTGSDSMLYISNNNTGQIFRIDIDDLEARLVMTSTSGLRLNDGFSCPTELPDVYSYDFGDKSGLPTTTNLVYTMDTPSEGIPDFEMVWIGDRVGFELTDPSNATATGDTYDDGLTTPSIYDPGTSEDLTIALNTNMSSISCYYGVWIDWNADDGFDAFYNGSSTISSSTDVTQAITVPADYGGGLITFRIRVGEEAIVQADSSGGLLLGETEDHLVLGTIPACFTFTKSTGTGLESEAENTWGAAWGDYDGDGDEDLLIPDFSHWKSSRIYSNNGDGTFTSVSVGSPTADKGSNVGGVWGDYDNDGDLDLYTANNVRLENKLYDNDGTGNFTTSSDSVASNYEGYSHAASWVDYDNDGYLDIFATDYMPTRFNQLFKNNGDGTFSLAQNATVNMEVQPTLSAAWGDYDNDGLIDVFVPNADGENNSLYHNNGNGRFSLVNSGSVSSDGGNSHSASWADYDNDGDLDLFVCNASNQFDFFYTNDGDGTFTKNTSLSIVTENGHSFGSVWGDFDLDGDLDLYVVHDNGNPNSFFFNDGDGTFTKDTQLSISTDTENSVSPTVVDYQNDGDLDIFIANNGYESNSLYINDATGCNNHYACFDLVGSAANKDAIGTIIKVKATMSGSPTWQMRQITSLSGGISAQSSLKAHFGVDDATTIDSVEIRWPSGYIQYLTSLSADACTTIVEPTGGTVTFLAFVDANGNCTYEAGETLLPNISGTISEIDHTIVTGANGEVVVNLNAGSYTYIEDIHADYTHPCYTSKAFTATNGSSTTVYLPHQATCSYPDVWVDLSGTAQRVGSRNTYRLSYGNAGIATAISPEIAVTFDADLTPVAADVAWDRVEGGNTYIWEFDSLVSFESGIITITDSVSILATLGDSVSVTATFQNLSNDCDLTDNSKTETRVIVGAIDPNDLLVLPKDTLMKGDYLTYRVRFQNVGTFFAEHVVVQDTLPESLDIETLQIVGASHFHELNILKDRIVEFKFDYIFLPDSGMNEVESHGFVEFTISAIENVQIGDVIENRAAIYFDNLPPIITNTTKTIVWDNNIPLYSSTNPNSTSVETEVLEAEELQKPEDLGHDFPTVFPNPVSDIAVLRFKGHMDQGYQISISNAVGGVQFRTHGMSTGEVQNFIISMRKWPTGIYFVILERGKEKKVLKLIKS
ncbi:MAG: FG-GAP-like repeat-containing protein [Bacteroidota bacterium]